MGFLDKKEQVVDLILTREGRRQLAEGSLRFRHFALFDDEVDYDPYVSNSGSFSDEQLEERRLALIEDTLVFEAFPGRLITEVSDADHVMGPASPLFDMPQGQTVLPRMSVTPDVTSSLLEVRQAVVSSEGPRSFPAGVMRQSPSIATFELSMRDYHGDQADHGVLVRLFTSGSDGLREIPPARDYLNEHSFGIHAKMSLDESPALVTRRAARGQGDTEV